MIISVLPFELKPGKVEDLKEVFHQYQILEKAIEVKGCRRLMIAQASSNSDQLFVVGIWDDQEAYQRWMDHPKRGGGAEELLALVAGGFEPADPAQLWDVLRSLDESDKLSDHQ